MSGSSPRYGETWTYESIVGALPGIDLTEAQAIALQVALFETSVLLLAWAYDLWEAVIPGTVAVGVAAAGSVVMLRISKAIRSTDVPAAYARVLFGSSVEVVLGVLAFVALVTYLFVFDPQQAVATGDVPVVVALFGETPPLLVVYVALLVLWDLCYRIGTSWWTAVVALWRSVRYAFDPETIRALRRVDLLNVAFGLVQLLLLPFVWSEPTLTLAIAGHVVAVTVVSVTAAVLLRES
ncbi:MAG: DUF7530 family protein [Halobacteriota archaeon]